MITAKDVIPITLTDDVVEFCKEHPVAGQQQKSTGQLKSIGNYVLREVLGVDTTSFNMQLEAARDMGVAYVCEVPGKKAAGVLPTVSLIKDQDIVAKRIVVPASQLYRHPYLDEHYTVGVFVVGTKNADGELDEIKEVHVAGWTPTHKLKRWIKKGGKPPFSVKHTSLAVAPCSVLQPIASLLTVVRWGQARV